MRRKETMRKVVCLLLIAAMTCTGLPVTALGEMVQETDVQKNNKATVGNVEEVADTPSIYVKQTGWVTNADGTWSYYDADGSRKTGWLLQGNNWYYLKSGDGIMAASETVNISGKLYYFKASGIMLDKAGWTTDGGKWYYARSGGALYTGWIKPASTWYYMDPATGAMCTNQWVDGNRYYVNSSGHMATGWVADPATGLWYYMKSTGLAASGWLAYKNHWYYIKSNGLMTTNAWVKSKGLWYYMDANGYMSKGWVQVGTDWYYMKSSGVMSTGWQKIGSYWYYMKSSGVMSIGWQKISGRWYYMKDSGAMVTGWKQIEDEWYYMNASGAMLTGWQKISNKWYYFASSGKMAVGKVGNYYLTESGAMATNKLVEWEGKYYYTNSAGLISGTGWKLIGGKWYYLSSNHSCATGWQKISGKWYYMDPATAVMKSGWLEINGVTYYMNSSGAMLTGWQKIGGVWYYLNSSGAMATGWKKINTTWYYLSASGSMKIGWQKIDSLWYYFYSSGAMATNTMIGNYYVDSDGVWTDTGSATTDVGTMIFKDVAPGGKTIKNLLQNGMKPVANTLYVWGGGWDSEAGGDARRIGTNPQWKGFYDAHAGNYDYDKYRYSYKNGLDCSGYIGWTIYNTINTESDKYSVTVQSTSVANYLVTTKGWGESTMLNNPTVFRAGDVCSMEGHVFMVVGTCSDGSIVILHSSPQAGVQLSGSVVPSTGSSNSKAYALAKKYNEKYFPYWKYETRCVGSGYLTKLVGGRCRWKVNGTGILTDPDNYLNKTADQILADLFGE